MNLMAIKKYAAFFVASFIPTVTFVLSLINFGLLWAVAIFIAIVIFVSLFGSRLLKNPFTDMLEGFGTLALTFDSTGVIEPFIVSVKPPYIEGGNGRNSIFDRDASFYLAAPKNASMTEAYEFDSFVCQHCGKELEPAGKVRVLKLPPNDPDYNFKLNNYLCFIYNKQLQSYVTKKALADMEANAMVKHMLLYLNKKVEELSSYLRDFARYIAEHTKPNTRFEFVKNPLFWIIMIFAIGIILMLFMPGIFQAVGNAVTSTKPITPR